MKNTFYENICIFSVIAIFSAKIIHSDFNSFIDFDSAFNLNVVKNFVYNGIYGTSIYLIDGQKYYWFDPWITTGPSVLLPIALFVKFTQNIFLVSRFVINTFFFVFIYVLTKLISKYIKNISLSKLLILNVTILLVYSKFFDNIIKLSHYVQGEIPGYTYTLIALLGFIGGYPAVMGIFLGLALLAKMQLFFLCIPLFIGGIYYYRKNIKSLLLLVSSFFFPIISYGLSLLLVFGFGLKRYYGDLKGVTIMQKAVPSLNFIFNLPERIQVYVNNYPIFFILVIISIIIGIISFKKVNLKSRIIILSVATFLLYFIFIWRFNSPGHIAIPKFICFIWIFYTLFEQIFHIKIQYFFYIMVLLLVMAISNISFIDSNKNLLLQQKAAALLIKKYNNATFYNIGWWKSPELMLLMDKDVIRVDKKNLSLCKKECYLLVSKNQILLDKNSLKEIKEWKLVENTEYIKLYKIR